MLASKYCYTNQCVRYDLQHIFEVIWLHTHKENLRLERYDVSITSLANSPLQYILMQCNTKNTAIQTKANTKAQAPAIE